MCRAGSTTRPRASLITTVVTRSRSRRTAARRRRRAAVERPDLPDHQLARPLPTRRTSSGSCALARGRAAVHQHEREIVTGRREQRRTRRPARPAAVVSSSRDLCDLVLGVDFGQSEHVGTDLAHGLALLGGGHGGPLLERARRGPPSPHPSPGPRARASPRQHAGRGDAAPPRRRGPPSDARGVAHRPDHPVLELGRRLDGRDGVRERRRRARWSSPASLRHAAHHWRWRSTRRRRASGGSRARAR